MPLPLIPLVIAGAAAGAAGAGGALGASNKSAISKKQRNSQVDYLRNGSTSKDLLNGYSQNYRLGNTATIPGIATPFFGTPGLLSSTIHGINSGVQSGNAGVGLKDALANLFTMGWYGLYDNITKSDEQNRWNNVTNNIDPKEFSNFSNNELNALLDYYTDEQGVLFKHDVLDDQAFINDYRDYLDWREKVGDMPADIDFDTLYANADSAVNNEVNSVQTMLDNQFAKNESFLNRQLQENNNAFLDYRNQVLTNNAMDQQRIAGATRFEMDRQQRNAISRGASAAQRLVANINAQLGTQAQSAQQSLETSNALAQQLLAQRQAQAGIRSDYMNMSNNYTNQKASLMNGLVERRANARNAAGAEAKTRWNDAMDQWERRLNSYGGNSPFTDLYRNQQGRADRDKSTYYNGL